MGSPGREAKIPLNCITTGKGSQSFLLWKLGMARTAAEKTHVNRVFLRYRRGKNVVLEGRNSSKS